LECFCTQCHKPVFKIVNDVTDPMPYGEFVNAYQPVGHNDRLGPTTEIADLSVDCPLCKESKSVPLTAGDV
jgi:hypothetical protein